MATCAEFAEHLTGDGIFGTAFQRVLFAVFDRTPGRTAIRPFERRFAWLAGRLGSHGVETMGLGPRDGRAVSDKIDEREPKYFQQP
jgi:hypothetical protein